MPQPPLQMRATQALRGHIVYLKANPFLHPARDCLVSHDDGLVVMADGHILAAGPYDAVKADLPVDLTPIHYPDHIIMPGFIDTHVHYPQLQMIGAYGEQLLEWLNTYTFVTEQQFSDRAHADRIAQVFLRELLRAGTTTAVVYCTVHPQSVDAFFEHSARLNTRMIAGKVLMDRNAPAALLDTATRAYDDSAALIAKWHGTGRQLYCVTPRFAPTSTDAQLDAARSLLRDHPGVYLQTHLCENRAEIDWVRDLFPDRHSYLDVYDHAGLVGPRSIFGHAIHMQEQDFCTCHDHGAAVAFCPTSNLFLGSGLFPLNEALNPDRPVRTGLGTDVGAGTSLSQLQTLNEAYKVQAMAGGRLDAIKAFWLATGGGAEALYLDQQLGRIEAGYEADLVVIDPKSTPLMAFRSDFCTTLEEQLFVLMTMGDDRAIRATWVAGECVHDRDA